MSDEPRKSNFDRWITIANLLLTALIGVGVALYLGWRDEATQMYLAQQSEESQVQLSQLQAEIERQAELAHLTVQQICHPPVGCYNSFDVINDGQAAAQNINLIVYLSYVQPVWQANVQDISAIKLSTNQLAFEYTVEPYRAEPSTRSTITDGMNALKVSIPVLPSKSRITFNLGLSPQVSVTEYTTATEITLSHDADSVTTIMGHLEDQLGAIFDERTGVGELWLNATCDNCEGETKIVSFPYSTVHGHMVNVPDQITVTSPVSLYVELTLDIPTGREPPALPNHLYLSGAVLRDY